MEYIQRLAMTKTAHFVSNKNAINIYGESVCFREKLNLHLLILDKAIKWGKSTFSNFLAGNLTVLLFLGLSLGIRKQHMHTHAR